MFNRKIAVNLSAWLLYLLPFTILTGSFLPDLSISIISLIFLYITFKEKLWKYYNNVYFFFFISFYIYLLISSLISDNTFYSLTGSLFYFRFGIFSLAVWYLLDKKKKELISRLILFFIAAYFISFIDGYYQYFYGENIFGLASPLNRSTLLLSENLLLGNYLVRLFPLFVALILFYDSSFKFIKILVVSLIFIFTDILIFISAERTSLGLMMISTVLIIIFVKKYKIIRIVTFLLSIVFMYFILTNNSEIKNRLVDQTMNEMNLLNNNVTNDDRVILFSSEHEGMYSNSIKMYLDNPISGIGPKLYRIKCKEKVYNKKYCSTHPHNTYMQIAAETGSIGLLFIFIPLSYVIFQFFKAIKDYFYRSRREVTDFQLSLLICIVLTLFPFLPTLNFFNNWINVIYYLPVGFYLHSIYKDKTS